jgi:N-acetylated-alpha-linked acidic dipeptidase
VDTIEEKAGAERPIRLEATRAAAARWLAAAERFESALAGGATVSASLSQDRIREINTLLLQVSRAMTERKGLQGRAFFKHLIYAPQPTYRPEVLPRIFEAIERGERDSIPRHEAKLVAAFERAAALLVDATALLAGEAP